MKSQRFWFTRRVRTFILYCSSLIWWNYPGNLLLFQFFNCCKICDKMNAIQSKFLQKKCREGWLFYHIYSILFLFLVYVMKIHQSVLSFGENIPKNAIWSIQQALGNLAVRCWLNDWRCIKINQVLMSSTSLIFAEIIKINKEVFTLCSFFCNLIWNLVQFSEF